MNKKLVLLVTLFFLSSEKKQNTYDPALVETETYMSPAKEPYAVLRMSRKNNRVKVKYFAAKNYDGTMVGKRYSEWSANKTIIAVSSGTYMTNCNAAIAAPVGLCIDGGAVVSEGLDNKLDGLIIVQATGGIVATDLKQADLSLTFRDGTKKTVGIRNNSFDFETFLDWAKKEEATVFQVSLFVYKDELRIGTNGSPAVAPRRFLAACKGYDGSITHYIINLPTAATLYDGTVKAKQYLKQIEGVQQIVFMINLDTGCQNIYEVNNSNGSPVNDRNFRGDGGLTVNGAANLLAYYYE
jgi:hypothetical protein